MKEIGKLIVQNVQPRSTKEIAMLAPRMLPPLELLISDIPLRKTQIANHLGITTRTLENYLKKQNAPRSVLLALYWETRWGKSHISAETTNYAQMNAALASSTKKCNEQLQNLSLIHI